MGVSGCGKSTVGEALAEDLGWPFIDADDYHPESNIRKMAAGTPLDDHDRLPWLTTLNQLLIENNTVVLACSALKEMYREVLGKNIPRINWVLLEGDKKLILDRMNNRTDHFMEPRMLDSQFATLENPVDALKVDIRHPVDKQVAMIKEDLAKSDIGLIGLGVMGKSLALNIADHGYQVSVHNPPLPGEETVTEEFVKVNRGKSLKGSQNIDELLDSVQSPRKILLMVKAGDPVDSLIELLKGRMEPGDVIVDLGNSHFSDTERREKDLEGLGIHFMGTGVSGGEEGARKGPSIMAGGSEESYQLVGGIFEDIAAPDKSGATCCVRVGPSGAGHFIKMIHNGIEYAEMQLLAELYHILSLQSNNEQISEYFRNWNEGSLESYLLKASADISLKKEGNRYVLDIILDEATGKGTGTWSSKTALDLGYPATMIMSAVNARNLSVQKSRQRNRSQEKTPDMEIGERDLMNAYALARKINHYQGFQLIKAMAEEQDWKPDFRDIARIWTNGCIIRSQLMEDIASGEWDILDPVFLSRDTEQRESLGRLLKHAISTQIPVPSFHAAWNFLLTQTAEKLPANLVQAMRDYFGSHGFRRNDQDDNSLYHENWY